MHLIHSIRDLLARRKAAAEQLRQFLVGIDHLPLSEFTMRRAHGDLTDEQTYAYSLRRKREGQVGFLWFFGADVLGVMQGMHVASLLCLAGALFYLAVLVDSELSLWRLRGGVGGLAQLVRARGWWRELFDGERLGLRLHAIQVNV